MTHETLSDGISMLSTAINLYLSEIDSCRDICLRNEKTAAIHDCGKELQLYRMFSRKRQTADQIRKAVSVLPSWKKSHYYEVYGAEWEKLKGEIYNRIEKHTKQYHVLLGGVIWEDEPVLVHVYKFDNDPRIKVELVVPPYKSLIPILPLKCIASLLRFHEYIVPELIAKPLYPFEGHDVQFLTVKGYLLMHMKKESYCAQCFPQSRLDSD